MTTQSPDATEQVERVARAIAEHFVARFGAKIEEDNLHIGFAMFNPPVPFRVNAANVARAAIAALPSNATTNAGLVEALEGAADDFEAIKEFCDTEDDTLLIWQAAKRGIETLETALATLRASNPDEEGKL